MARFLPVVLLLLAETSPIAAEPTNGWRGNGTGRWPDARPPLEWYRRPKGIITDLRVRGDRPGAKATDGLPLQKGIIRDWLVLGPFPVKDSVQDFAKAQLADEAGMQPALGDKVGVDVWKSLTAKIDDRWEFGPAGAPFADVGVVVGYHPNQVAYAQYPTAPRFYHLRRRRAAGRRHTPGLEQDVGRHDPRRHVTPPNTRSTVAFASTASGTKPHTLR